MTITIELSPEEERELLDRVRASGRDLTTYVRGVIREHIDRSDEAIPEDMIDHDVVAECMREIEGQEIPTIEEVRAILSKIPGSMAQAVIEERNERF